MKIHVLAIYDKVAKMYMQPMFVNNVQGAIRGFTDEINRQDDNSNLWKHSEDFDLYYMGQWDDEDGVFRTEDEQKQYKFQELLIKGAACKRST